jgi:hypothetical protein
MQSDLTDAKCFRPVYFTGKATVLQLTARFFRQTLTEGQRGKPRSPAGIWARLQHQQNLKAIKKTVSRMALRDTKETTSTARF